MKLDLPPTSTEQPPLFTALDQCRAWLKTLPLSSPVQAQAQLMRQLGLLNRYSLEGGERLLLLEALREPIHFVQGEAAKKFSGKPLPLAPPEHAAFESAHALRQALVTGYLRCLDACLAGDAALKPRAAQICQRTLAALAEDHIDQVRAGYQIESEHWHQAHLTYVGAEELQATTTACEDGLRAAQPMTPTAAYAELMLLHAASLHELTPRQQTWVMRWARRWANKVTIQATPPALDSPALPLCVDLAGDAPAGFKPFAGAGARWLVTTELRKSLKRRLKLLAEGGEENTPARLGLGDDCPQPQCGEVLRRIYPRWVKGGILRRHERHPMSGACRFVVGVDAIHYYLSDHQPFKPPGSTSTEDLRRQRDELATFGRVAARFEDEYSQMHGYQLENWEVIEDWGMLDHSTGGLRLVRPLRQEGGRIGIGQLVAVQPASASGLLLGVVRWVQIAGAQLATGIQLLPGKPMPVAVRGTGVMAAQEKYRPGFLLPPLEALKLPASIVLPPGSYKPERIMETWFEGATQQFKLKASMDRGADFERAACEAFQQR
jgi:hypothetical protein